MKDENKEIYIKRQIIREIKSNRKRANRYRKQHGLPDSAIVILMPIKK